MPSGTDGRPRNLLQRDRRTPLCPAARSGRSSRQALCIRDRQRVSALVSTPRRFSRLLPSYPGHGWATLIHSCKRFLNGSEPQGTTTTGHVVRLRPCTARPPGPAATAVSVVHAGGIPDPRDRGWGRRGPGPAGRPRSAPRPFHPLPDHRRHCRAGRDHCRHRDKDFEIIAQVTPIERLATP